MDAPAIKRMTVPEFLAWAETQQQGRYELVHGEIVAMAPERSEHIQAKRRIANALEAAIAHAGVACESFEEGLAVVVDNNTGYLPDVLVNCGEPTAPEVMIASNPVIVVEILSPSTRRVDTSIKLADYFRVPRVSHYLVVDLRRRHILHYRRQSDGVVAMTVMTDGEIACEPPGITVPVANFFG
jgi:Uma2 family endonuclease